MVNINKDNLYKSSSEAETIEFAEKFAGELKSGDVIVLSGPLGAGKTTFIKGLAKGLGISSDAVRSPSFTLVNEYRGDADLYHFDLYRMKDISELIEIGWDDYLMRDGIVVVEWGEKAGEYIADDYIKIDFEIVSDNSRDIRVSRIKK